MKKAALKNRIVELEKELKSLNLKLGFHQCERFFTSLKRLIDPWEGKFSIELRQPSAVAYICSLLN